VRKYGLTIDDLLAAEIVTADGELLYVDSDTHPDLFWAIRGGGGNFGVATRFKFRLHEVDTIVGGMLMLPATPEVIASFVAEAEAAPEELSSIANVMVAPPMPFLPAEAHGRLVIMALLCYAGEVDEGERAIAPFRALATPLADTVGPKPYPQMYEPAEPGPDEEVARSLFIDTVDSGVAEKIVEHLRASTAPLAVAQIRVLGGAMARVSADATAFTHRERGIMVALGAVYERAEETAMHEEYTSTSSATRARRASVRHIRGRPSSGSRRSRAATTQRTFSGSTRTSRLRPGIEPDAMLHRERATEIGRRVTGHQPNRGGIHVKANPLRPRWRRRESPVRKVIVPEFVSLDGVLILTHESTANDRVTPRNEGV
jgi:FAD/FMN-containing dehydrogenase